MQVRVRLVTHTAAAGRVVRLCTTAARRLSTMDMRIRFHINAALDAGATEEEIVATLYDFAPYFGTALARHALCVALEEFARRTPRAVESGRREQRLVRGSQQSARRVWLS